MNNTLARFEELKKEIEFYYSILIEFGKPDCKIKTIDNSRFERILKSNYLLMLYNLIESCIKSGFEEIYEVVGSNENSYLTINEALRDIWSSYEISKSYKDTSTKQTYAQRVKDIINQVISNSPIILTRESLDISGNLDARQIKELLHLHKIYFTETNPDKDKSNILKVKNKRNKLAHGDESFDDAARDLTIGELEEIKDEVLIFIEDVLNGMKDYYNNKLYLINADM